MENIKSIRKKVSQLHTGILTHRMNAHWYRAVVIEYPGVNTPKRKIQRHIDSWKWLENTLRNAGDNEMADHVVTRIDTLECLMKDF